MSGIDEADVPGLREADPQATGRALVVVDLDDLSSEAGIPPEVYRFFRDLGRVFFLGCHRPEESLGLSGEIAGHECFAHEHSVFRQRHQNIEAVGEAGEDESHLFDQRGVLQGLSACCLIFPSRPKILVLETTERIFGGVFVVVPADQFESSGEALAQFIAPRNSVWSGEAFIQQVEDSEKKEGFVWPFVTCSIACRGDPDIQGVELLDGLGERRHSERLWRDGLSANEKDQGKSLDWEGRTAENIVGWVSQFSGFELSAIHSLTASATMSC